MKNGIVIPCFNTAAELNLNKIEEYVDRNSRDILCFVNNGSEDETLNVLKNLQRRLLNSHKCLATQVLICNLSENVSKEDAIKSGKHHLSINTLVKNIQVCDVQLVNNSPREISKMTVRSFAA